MPSDPLKNRHLALGWLEPGAPEGAEARARADEATALVVPFVPGAESPPSAPPAGKDAPPPLSRLTALDAAQPRSGDDACLDEDLNRAGGAVPVACPSAPLMRFHLAQLCAQAARGAEGLLLEGLDRWYALGPHGAGFCPTCEMALTENLRRIYGEHVQPFRALEPLKQPGLPARQRPFAGLREQLRFSEPLASAKAAIVRARDEARKGRGLELPVFARTGTISGLTLSLCRHLDGLLFDLPVKEPLQALLPLLAARAALGERPAVAVLPGELDAARVRLYAALAGACDVDVALEPGASAAARAALAEERRYRHLLRERYRPAEPLADVEIYLSPVSDHWSGGQHLAASASAVAALASANLQLGVRLERLPEKAATGDASLLVLAGASELHEEQAGPLRKFVEQGGDLVLVGPCAVVDDEGRAKGPLFPEAKAGLERLGEGRLWTVAANAQGELPAGAALEALVLRAARELLGRRRPQLSLSGRGQLWARAYLDPERKLDVHLTNLETKLDEAGALAQGLLLTIAGAAAGGGRTAFWFAPGRTEGKDGERIALNPSGFAVSTVLPALGSSALLSVPR